MNTLSITNPADREELSRRAYKIVAANEPPMSDAAKQAARKKKNSDALTRERYARAQGNFGTKRSTKNTEDEENMTGEAYLNGSETISKPEDSSDETDSGEEYRDDVESVSGAEEDELEGAEYVSEEEAAGEYSCGSFEHQESAYERYERKKQRKAQATLEAALLSEQLLANLTAILRVAIPNVLRHPTSAAEFAWALAFQEAFEKQTGRAKFAERYATEHGTSKSTIERQVREGRKLWANLAQVALGLKIEPETVIEFLSTLPREMQLRVAHVAEQHRAEWEVSEEVDRYKKAKRLSHGILNKLPESKIVDRATRLRLTELTEAQQKREVAEMRVDEKLKLREADDLAKQRESRSNARFAAASSNASRVTKAVQAYLSMSAAERADIQSVLGLQANNSNQESVS